MTSIYDTFTIEEAGSVGKKFRAVCIGNRGMEEHLTNGTEYTITITPRILPLSPLCSFISDKGASCECHLHRFENRGEILERG